MADGLNRVYLIGNLGADPELRHTQGDQAVLNLRMATTESWADKNGERQERTDWHNVTIWGKRGEGLARCLQKGSRLCVEGRIQTREYEKDGQKRWATDIVATNVVLLDGRREGAGDGGRRDERDDRDRDRRPARDERSPARDDRRREPPPRREREPERAPQDDFAPPSDRMPY